MNILISHHGHLLLSRCLVVDITHLCGEQRWTNLIQQQVSVFKQLSFLCLACALLDDRLLAVVHFSEVYAMLDIIVLLYFG